VGPSIARATNDLPFAWRRPAYDRELRFIPTLYIEKIVAHESEPGYRPITFQVPDHLREALVQTVETFMANACGTTGAAQRAAEIRAQDRDAGLDALWYLVTVAEGDSSQADIVARFLAGLYNGFKYPLDLAVLRQLERDLLERCLQTLRLQQMDAVQVQRYFPHGEARWRAIIQRQGIQPRDAAQLLPDEDVVAPCQYQVKLDTSGYRNVTLFVKLFPGGDNARSIGLTLSAVDCGRLTVDLLAVHRAAWAPGRPRDAEECEPRPAWLNVP
jgi:hypothetical protein